ncbi:MAG: pentapeptide repeat-containing protein, partial [Planktothrix sp.]
ETENMAELAKIAGLDICRDFAGSDLSGTDLSRLDLRGADFEETDFESANLSYADLSHANLTNANLTNANLDWANFSDANLKNANFSNASVLNIVLTNANCQGIVGLSSSVSRTAKSNKFQSSQDSTIKNSSTLHPEKIYIVNQSNKKLEPNITMNFQAPVTGVAGTVQGDQIINNNRPDLAESMLEIQKLWQQFEQNNNVNLSQEEEAQIQAGLVKINQNPTLQKRFISALKSGSVEALKEVFNHPAVNIGVAFYEGWTNP